MRKRGLRVHTPENVPCSMKVYVQKQSGKVPHKVLFIHPEKPLGKWSTTYEEV